MRPINRRIEVFYLSSGMRWRLMAVFLTSFLIALGLSSLDWRQTLSLAAIGALAGLATMLICRREYVLWGLVIGLPLLVTVVIDGNQLPEILSRFRVLVGATLVLVSVIGVLSRRLVLALAVSVFLVAIISAASFTKLDYVGAPLIWHDLSVAARSWDMFLELETDKLIVVLLLVTVFPFIGWLEPKAGQRFTWLVVLIASGSAAILLPSAQLPGQHQLLDASFDMRSTSHLIDPVAYFLGSALSINELNEPRDMPTDRVACCLRASRDAERLDTLPTKAPHVVIVLFESTFDPSVIVSSVKPKKFFSQAHPLNIHTIGGSTWVAEYALLHGVAPPVYGAGFPVINLLGPGKADGRLPVIMRSAGYMTTTIYPVAGRFYGARTFHGSLGIERFIECSEVDGCDGRPWSERADRLFLNKAMQTMAASAIPQFIFLPTIQQHSPHAGLKVVAGSTLPCDLSIQQCQVMWEYLRRLDSSLDDFDQFLTKLQGSDRDSIVLAFGDHIPGDFNRFFTADQFRSDKKKTFFTVWHSRRGYLTTKILQRVGNPKHLDVAYLDWVIAVAAGFDSKYFRQKEAMIRQCAGDYCLEPSAGKLL